MISFSEFFLQNPSTIYSLDSLKKLFTTPRHPMMIWRFVLKIFVILVLTSDIYLALSDDSSEKPKHEESDLLAPWKKRWEDNRIGFHKQDVNEWLLQYGHLVIPNFSAATTTAEVCSTGSGTIQILVPLCGKTVDMAFLAQETSVERVVGVEGIRQALLDFAEENPQLEIQPSSDPTTVFEQFQGKNITLLKGNFFDILLHKDASSSSIPRFASSFDVIWDRASIVAIDPSLRPQYVQLLFQLLKPGGRILLLTVEKRTGTVPEALRIGPPYSLSEMELRELLSSFEEVRVSKLEERDEFAANPQGSQRFRDAGVTSMFELLFEIEKVKNVVE